MSQQQTAGPTSTTQRISSETVRHALVASVIVVLPFGIQYLLLVDVHTEAFRPLLGSTTVGPLELLLLLLAVAAAPILFRRTTYSRWSIALVGVICYTAVTAVWLLIDPHAEGVVRLVRLAGIAGVVAVVATMSARQFTAFVVWPLTASVLVQSVWALLQTLVWDTGHRSAITNRWDHAWTQGHGSMDGGYGFAAFAILAIAVILSSQAYRKLHPVMWASVVVASLSVSVTFGRLGVIAVLMISGVYGLAWLITRKRGHLLSSIAVGVPMLVGIAATWSGWSVRASETVSLNTSNRASHMERAFDVISQHPFLGVGPGNFGRTLMNLGYVERASAVHNVPILISAEYGIPVGVLFTAWLIALGAIALITSPWAVGVFVAIVPYLLFDHPHVSYVYGVVELGIWLAALEFHARSKPSRQPPSTPRGRELAQTSAS